MPVAHALQRWPNVPACYGWLSLDRRGQWRLRGEAVTHRGLNDFLNRNYSHDEDGNYFVQNGPQKVFVELAYTPWVVRLAAQNDLEMHTGAAVDSLLGAALDDEGSLLIETQAGIALLCDRDLPALLPCLRLADGGPADETSLLACMTGSATLTLTWKASAVPVRALRRVEVAKRYRFIASPQPAPAAP